MIKCFKASKRADGGFFDEQTSPCFPKACGSPSSRLWGISHDNEAQSILYRGTHSGNRDSSLSAERSNHCVYKVRSHMGPLTELYFLQRQDSSPVMCN